MFKDFETKVNVHKPESALVVVNTSEFRVSLWARNSLRSSSVVDGVCGMSVRYECQCESASERSRTSESIAHSAPAGQGKWSTKKQNLRTQSVLQTLVSFNKHRYSIEIHSRNSASLIVLARNVKA